MEKELRMKVCFTEGISVYTFHISKANQKGKRWKKNDSISATSGSEMPGWTTS